MTRFLACVALVLAASGAAFAQDGGLRAFGFTEAELDALEPRSPDPILAYLADGVEPDTEYWSAKRVIDGVRRARLRSARGFRSAPSATYRERERAVFNPNDATAEPIPAEMFGDAADEPIVKITGIYETPVEGTGVRLAPTSEDGADGSVMAMRVRLSGANASGSTTVAGRIGDGPFATTTGDVDAYDLVVPEAGTYTWIEVETPTGTLDPTMALYGPDGDLLYVEVDQRDRNGSVVSSDPGKRFFAEAAGTYRLYVWGRTPGARSPGLRSRADARSGYGVGSTGPYDLVVQSFTPDVDRYSVELDAGDVLAAVSVDPTSDLAIFGPDGELLMRSRADLSSGYPDEGPLLSPAELGAFVGGVTVAAVVPSAGRYVVEARGEGSYELFVQGARPGHERPGANAVETIYVDFGGGTYYPQRDLGGTTADTTYLSPLRSFLPRWGLTEADESAVVDAFMRTFQRTLRDALRADVPGMADLDVVFLNSRDHADPGPGVNRLVVAGTADEIGQKGFIGQASTVDIGNFRQDDIAYVLLGLRSASADNPNSLNQFTVAAPRTKAELVGHGMGTVAAHEAGHFFGLHHTENDNEIRNVQDAGPGVLWHVLDVGSDGVFGPGDGDDVRFRSDLHERSHPFTGTLLSSDALAHSLHTAKLAVPGAASGGAEAVLREAGFSFAAIGSASGRPYGRLLARETFASDPEGAWRFTSEAGHESRVQGGAVRITAGAGKNHRRNGGDLWIPGGDFALRVDLRYVEGCATNGAGFYFRWSDNAFNTALVDVAGESWTRGGRWDGSSWVDLAAWERTPLGRPDAWNTLELVVVGGRAHMILNGLIAREMTVPVVSGQSAVGGLLVYSCPEAAMTYDFDNYAVVELGTAPLAAGAGLRSFESRPSSAGVSDAPATDAHEAESPMPDSAGGEVGVRSVTGGAPAARGFLFSFGLTRVRLTEGDGQPRLWVLTPDAEIWREARAGEVAALLDGDAPAVASETPLSGTEAEAALTRLRALAASD